MATKPRLKRGGSPLQARKAWATMVCGCPVSVDAEQRRHLIECCAFFRAERFRAVQPGRYRRQDLRDATADIDAVLRVRRGRTHPVHHTERKARAERRVTRVAERSLREK